MAIQFHLVIFYITALCNLVGECQSSNEHTVSIFRGEMVYSFETLVPTYLTTRRDNPENYNKYTQSLFFPQNGRPNFVTNCKRAFIPLPI
jgi:hypothetical protein